MIFVAAILGPFLPIRSLHRLHEDLLRSVAIVFLAAISISITTFQLKIYQTQELCNDRDLHNCIDGEAARYCN